MHASIIIPYHERKAHLKIVLDSLLNQTINKCDYEILVIDDGSKDSIEDIISSDVTWIRTPHRGAAAARNTGISQAKGQIVIFLDGDIVVEPAFIENHCNFQASNPMTVGLGSRYHMRPTGNAEQNNDTRLKLLARYKKQLKDLTHPWFMTYTCNVSINREQAQRTPFDENFITWGLEDTEWAYRLYRQGYTFDFIASVSGLHLYHDRTMTNIKFHGWKNNLNYMVSKHPELDVLRCFESVFNPETKCDYFEIYDKFEETTCVFL